MKTARVRYVLGALCALVVLLAAGCVELMDIIVPPPQGPELYPHLFWHASRSYSIRNGCGQPGTREEFGMRRKACPRRWSGRNA